MGPRISPQHAAENLSYQQIVEKMRADGRQLKVIEECAHLYLRYATWPRVGKGNVFTGPVMMDYLDQHARNHEEWAWIARAAIAKVSLELEQEQAA